MAQNIRYFFLSGRHIRWTFELKLINKIISTKEGKTWVLYYKTFTVVIVALS